jgi:hypothetical protein
MMISIGMSAARNYALMLNYKYKHVFMRTLLYCSYE